MLRYQNIKMSRAAQLNDRLSSTKLENVKVSKYQDIIGGANEQPPKILVFSYFNTSRCSGGYAVAPPLIS